MKNKSIHALYYYIVLIEEETRFLKKLKEGAILKHPATSFALNSDYVNVDKILKHQEGVLVKLNEKLNSNKTIQFRSIDRLIKDHTNFLVKQYKDCYCDNPENIIVADLEKFYKFPEDFKAF